MLYLFGRLRGIKESCLKQNVEFILNMVDLKKHSKFISSNLSGGNKRKLCLVGEHLRSLLNSLNTFENESKLSFFESFFKGHVLGEHLRTLLNSLNTLRK